MRLTGVKWSEFVEIGKRIKALWDEKVESKKQCIGRSRCLKRVQDKVLALLLYYRTYITYEEVTEHPIRRSQPAKKRKKTYCGKKKKYTQKTELVMAEGGKLLMLSHTPAGRKHDFRIRKEEKPLYPSGEKYVDLAKAIKSVHGMSYCLFGVGGSNS